MLGKKLRFRNYANGNIKITVEGMVVPITCNTIMKLKGNQVSLRDSKKVIDDLIAEGVIRPDYVSEINESGNKMLVYELNQGE